jgi:hypothetical protein
VQAWKEKSEVCKRLLTLVNFNNITAVRVKALELVRSIVCLSPLETLPVVLQTIHASFFMTPSSQILLGYSTNTSCASITPSGPGNSSSSLKNSLAQCPVTNQLVTQIFTLMGSHFPINTNNPSGASNKKLTGILANLRQSGNNSNLPKPVFNMFMPIVFVAHAHMNGSVTLVTGNTNAGASPGSPDYDKVLMDAYLPFLTFFDWLCKATINRYGSNNKLYSVENKSALQSGSTSNENNTSTNNNSSVTNLPQIKQLIDLILIVTLNASVLNISFLQYLNESLFVKKKTTGKLVKSAEGNNKEGCSASNSESSSASSSSSSCDASPGKSKRKDDKEICEEFMEILVQSPMLPQLVNTMLTNFRYHLNRKEIYRFIHAVLPRCIVIAGELN